MAKCLLCNEFNDVSVQNSGRKKVPIADGIRCDSKEKLQYIVDHLLGPVHQGVLQHKNLLTLWNQRDSQHPLIKTIKDHDPEVIRTLTDLAVCVHNDSKLFTPAAWSWPSRSLANLHAE